MFNLFGGSSTVFDVDVEKATSENNTTEQWDMIIQICDKAGANSRNAKDCLRSIMKRMGHTDPHVAIQAITLLDACIKNCGRTFHLEIASREFETEFQRLMAKAHTSVAQKMRVSLKKWAENEFKTDHVLNLIPSLYEKLKNEYDFSDTSIETPKPQAMLCKDPNVVSSQQEEDDIAKAIELSLRDKGTDTVKSQAPLYPSMNLSGKGLSSPKQNLKKDGRKVRALYDFEAAEDNEITFFSGEIIYVLDDSDSNWWTGYNDRGEGLFPANFVTADLNAEIETNRYDDTETTNNTSIEKRGHQPNPEGVQISIDEMKIDRLLHLLHEANPEDPSQDSQEMFILEAHVNQMLPLIDSELERVDRNHAKLTQLSTQLVEAINMYHMLMRESDIQAQYTASFRQSGQIFSNNGQIFNPVGPPQPITGPQHHENSAQYLQQLPPIHQHVTHMGPYFGVLPSPVGSSLDSQHATLNSVHLPNTVMTTQVQQQGIPQPDQSTFLSQTNIPMYQPR